MSPTCFRPATQWDSSATLYLHKLLKGEHQSAPAFHVVLLSHAPFVLAYFQASTRTEAVLLESLSDCTSIELYVTIGNVKVSV